MDGGGRDRGQSEVIAVALLLAIAVAGSTAIVLYGGQAVDGSRDAVRLGAAEHGMTQFDSRASLVAHGDSDSQRIDFGDTTGERYVDEDRGWMNVTVRSEGTVTQLRNATLGAVVYERGDTTIAYQGGGVWRSDGNASSMLSPPEFHYRGTTLTLPLVSVSGDGPVGGDVQVRRNGSTGIYPVDGDPDRTNPLANGTVYVTVGSEYYEAWGRFFESRTGGNVSVDHADETVRIELQTPQDTQTVGAALSSGAAGDEIDMQGSGGDPAYIDAYNSSESPYPASQTDNGTLLTAGGVSMSGNAEIRGNVRAGGTIEMSGNTEITDEAAWTTGFSANGAATFGSSREIDGVDTADDIDGFVQGKMDGIEADNDNDNTTAVESEALNYTAGTVTLTAGSYHLDNPDPDSKRIVLDTTGGPIEVAVADDLQLTNTDVEVQGPNVVRLYVGDDITFEDGSNVSVPGDRSRQLWVYGLSDESSITIEGSGGDPTTVTGVVYLPSSDDGDVSIKHAEVFGAVVGGEMDIDNGGVVHYDEMLATESALPTGADVPRITYLHLSVTEVAVGEDGDS